MIQNTDRKVLPGHNNVVWDVVVSKDGTELVSVSHDETIRWWDTMKGEEKRQSKVGACVPYVCVCACV